jgi:hypothetical protein
MVDFTALPLWVNIVIFIGTAGLVWLAGVRLMTKRLSVWTGVAR